MTHEAGENRALLNLYDAYPKKKSATSSHEAPFISPAIEENLIAWYFLKPFLTQNPEFQDKTAKGTYRKLIESRVATRFDRVRKAGGSFHSQMGMWLTDQYDCYDSEDLDLYQAAYTGMGFVLDAALMHTDGSIIAEANALGGERLNTLFGRMTGNPIVTTNSLSDINPFPDSQTGLNKLIWPLSEIVASNKQERQALFDGATSMFYVACDIQDTPYDN